jgi:hypothetical protein
MKNGGSWISVNCYKSRAQTCNAVIAYRGVYSADCLTENGHTAGRQAKLGSGLSQAGIYRRSILGLSAEVGNPESV